MKSFFINTATRYSTIAILDDFQIVDFISIEKDKNLSNSLFQCIQELFFRNSVSPEEIKKIFISIGPGSFTGIRIGLTIAKIWASFYKIPLYPISSLEILASANKKTVYSCALIDARRSYVYGAIYDSSLNAVLSDCYISVEKIYNDASKLSSTFCSYDTFDFSTQIENEINIEKIVRKHWNDEPVNPHTLVPVYLKQTEAEERLKNV